MSADWVAAALEETLKARAPGLHASTTLVRNIARRMARHLGLDQQSQALLDVSVRVRDIGMVTLPDSVVLATEPLPPAAWELVNRHPSLGADILRALPPVAPAAIIVLSHHERWDGEGYPDGRSGDQIPQLSRIIAACDAFVAMASDRPYRRGVGTEAALEQIRHGRDSQFDPQVADALIDVLSGKRHEAAPAGRTPDAPAARRTPGAPAGEAGASQPAGSTDLRTAIRELQVIPALAPAYEQALAAITGANSSVGEIVAAIESDMGLTLAVLRRAQVVPTRRPVTNVFDAVSALGPELTQETISALPLSDLPWPTSPTETALHRARVHGQAVARAAEHIARGSARTSNSDVLVAALLHDIGKMISARGWSTRVRSLDDRTTTPEERLRQEQHALGIDHASLGGALLRRWGLPEQLAGAVASHHKSEAPDEVATYVRLADMLAHHAQGEAVNRTIMLRLGEACGLSAVELRDVLFDLPHVGGSRRRRSEPSPLTRRETEVIRLLAAGKLYKVIAAELGLSVSTIRTHLNHVYDKLGVVDRAQAVLRATEMGWI